MVNKLIDIKNPSKIKVGYFDFMLISLCYEGYPV